MSLKRHPARLEMRLALLLCAGFGVGLFIWAVQRALYDAMARYRLTYTIEAEHRLRDLFLFVDASLLWPAALVMAVMVGGGVFLLNGGLVLSVFAASACLFCPKLMLSWARAARAKAFETQLPHALSAMAAAMRAGASFSLAMQSLTQHALSPLSQEFSVVNREIRLGVAVPDAIQQMANRMPSEALTILSATVRVAVRTGGPMAAMLEQTAQTLLANHQIRQRLSALMAQGWLQAWVMGAMPPGLMLILSAMDESFGQALVSSVMGYVVVALVAGLECLGLWWLFCIARAGQSG